MARFLTDRLYLDQPELLIGRSRFSFLKPPGFARLKSTDDKKVQSEIYSNLKKWLHDSGKIDYEDMAFFHMRDVSAKNWLAKVFLGRVFGWGVRLTNIGLSSLVVLMLFAGYFFLSSEFLTVGESTLLSLQSFTGAFFGAWNSDLSSGNGLLFAVALESYIGVLFITTFVGAYVRKLLR